MQRSWPSPAHRVRGAAVLVTVLTTAASVHAEPLPVPGAEALGRARTAWERGDYDVAEPLYRQAIERGGLAPEDVLDAYVRLGSTRSILKKRDGALAAFKAAALIDSHFKVPSEAGKKAALLADRARRAEARIGPIVLHAEVSGSLDPGQSAEVDATLDAAHAAIATKIAILARDPMTGKSYAQAETATTSVHFKVPPSLALPSATIVVRVDALDAHDNRLASVEQKVRVSNMAPRGEAPDLISALDREPHDDVSAPKAGSSASADSKSKGGFWSTPWPYVLGGAALAAGGAAVYAATRSSNDVSIGQVRVQLTR